jgi:hypothetical protein
MSNFYTLTFIAIMFSLISSCTEGRKRVITNKIVPLESAPTKNGVQVNAAPESSEKINTFTIYYDSTKEVLNNPGSYFTQVVDNEKFEKACHYSYTSFLAIHDEVQKYINYARASRKKSNSTWRDNYSVALEITKNKTEIDLLTVKSIIDRINGNIRDNQDCPELQHPEISPIAISATASSLTMNESIFEGFKIDQEDKIFCFPCATGIENELFYGILRKRSAPAVVLEPKETKIAASYSKISATESIKPLCELSEDNFKEIQKSIESWASQETGVSPEEYSKLGQEINKLMLNNFGGEEKDIVAKYKLIEAINAYFAKNTALKCPSIFVPEEEKYLVKFNSIFAQDGDKLNFTGVKMFGSNLKSTYCLPCLESKDGINKFVFGIFESVVTVQESAVAAPAPEVAAIEFNKTVNPNFPLHRCYELEENASKIESLCFYKLSLDAKNISDYQVDVIYSDKDPKNYSAKTSSTVEHANIKCENKIAEGLVFEVSNPGQKFVIKDLNVNTTIEVMNTDGSSKEIYKASMTTWNNISCLEKN